MVPIEIPPLRERRADIEPLARHLLARVGARHGRSLRLAPEALRSLLLSRWPGNVRELENALEYAVAVCRSETIHDEDLPIEILETAGSAPELEGGFPAGPPAPGNGERGERGRLRAALEAHQWRREEAARALGMSRTTLWRKMREHALLQAAAGCNA